MVIFLRSLILRVLTIFVITLLFILSACNSNNALSTNMMPVIVGGKLDTEAQLLTEIYSLLLRRAGFDVIEKAALGNTEVNLQAIIHGSIDIYPEFTGTGLNTLNIPTTHNPQQDYLNVKDGFESRYKITWLEPAPLNDGYALCTLKDEAQNLAITNLSQLAHIVSSLVLAAPGDSLSIIDSLQSIYGFGTKSFKSIQTVDYATGFTAVANNQAQINVCYTTDGTVEQQNFVFLQDDKHGFPEFHPAPIVRDSELADDPGIANVLNQVAPKLTTDVSIMLQAEVNSGLSVNQVATTWLKTQGLF
jgi:osmoprotectant transport system substrate-binding protein